MGFQIREPAKLKPLYSRKTAAMLKGGSLGLSKTQKKVPGSLAVAQGYPEIARASSP